MAYKKGETNQLCNENNHEQIKLNVTDVFKSLLIGQFTVHVLSCHI